MQNKNKGEFIIMRRDNLKHILLIITIFFTFFIFINSMFPADASAEQSGKVLESVKFIFLKLNINVNITEHFIRKAAHFTEYSILGFLLILTEIEYTDNILSNIFRPLFAGLVIPVTDETIQLFVEGRSGQVSDILLDFSGVIFGFFIAACIYNLFMKKRRHRVLRFKYKRR